MNNILLIRDNFNDQGQIPTEGRYCTSPDIICHKQFEFPEKTLIETYDSKDDIGERFNEGEQFNLIYTRLKNLSNTPQTAYIRLYHANASLFMHPEIWKDNVIQSVYTKTDYTRTNVISAGGIGVATEPFGFDPLSTQNHCHVCIASTTPEPPVIPPMRSINDYIKWVHENTNVSMRNISSWRTERATLESIKSIFDPFGKQGRVVIFADINGFIPKGTRIILKCEPLEIESEELISQDKTFHSASGTGQISKNFQGFFKCYIFLPKGTTTKLILNLDYTVERDQSNDVAREFCIHPRVLFDKHCCRANPVNYIEMVKVGQCTDIFDVVDGK